MSRNSKRKKWKKEDVKRKVLEHLITLTEKEEETTKYKIQKALGVPLSTLLQAIKNLEEGRLVEHKEGKRGSHRCRLTLKGLIYCLNERIIDLERAKDVFLKMLKNNGVTKNEIVERLNISEMALSCYIKALLMDLLDEFRLSNEIGEYELSDIVFEGKGRVAKKLFSMFMELGSPWEILTRPVSTVYYSLLILGRKEEVLEFLKWVANNINEDVFKNLDISEQTLLSWKEDKWTIKKWINVGCLHAELKFKLEWDDLVRLFENGKCDIEIKIENLFKSSSNICPLTNKECKRSHVKEILTCEHFKKFYEAYNFEMVYFWSWGVSGK